MERTQSREFICSMKFCLGFWFNAIVNENKNYSGITIDWPKYSTTITAIVGAFKETISAHQLQMDFYRYIDSENLLQRETWENGIYLCAIMSFRDLCIKAAQNGINSYCNHIYISDWATSELETKNKPVLYSQCKNDKAKNGEKIQEVSYCISKLLEFNSKDTYLFSILFKSRKITWN